MDFCYFCCSREDLGTVTIDVPFTWRGAAQDGEKEVVCCHPCSEYEDVYDDWTEQAAS